jgi:hypothetical protein
VPHAQTENPNSLSEKPGDRRAWNRLLAKADIAIAMQLSVGKGTELAHPFEAEVTSHFLEIRVLSRSSHG